MSVSLTISRKDETTEFVCFLGQRSAEQWVGEVARQHGFRILTGEYPTLLLKKSDLDQVIFEVQTLADLDIARVDNTPHFSAEDRQGVRLQWKTVTDRLHQLKDEDGWEAHFG